MNNYNRNYPTKYIDLKKAKKVAVVCRIFLIPATILAVLSIIGMIKNSHSLPIALAFSFCLTIFIIFLVGSFYESIAKHNNELIDARKTEMAEVISKVNEEERGKAQSKISQFECEYCGAYLGEEDKVCPNCGSKRKKVK